MKYCLICGVDRQKKAICKICGEEKVATQTPRDTNRSDKAQEQSLALARGPSWLRNFSPTHNSTGNIYWLAGMLSNRGTQAKYLSRSHRPHGETHHCRCTCHDGA